MGLDAPGFFRAIEVARTTNYFDLAGLVVLIYDHLLSFSDEVTLVWKANWSAGRILYILARYSAYVDTVLTVIYTFSLGSTLSHKTLYHVKGWLIACGGLVAEIVLVYRTFAIWNQHRVVRYLLVILLMATAIAGIILTYYGLQGLTVLSNSNVTLKSMPRCLIYYSDNKTVLWDYAIVAVFETVILILTLVKAFEHYKFAYESSLARALYRDGLLFYIYLLGLTVANVATIDLVSSGPSLILLQRVFNGILPAHILLHIWKAAIKDDILGEHPEPTNAYSTYQAYSTYSTRSFSSASNPDSII